MRWKQRGASREGNAGRPSGALTRRCVECGTSDPRRWLVNLVNDEKAPEVLTHVSTTAKLAASVSSGGSRALRSD